MISYYKWWVTFRTTPCICYWFSSISGNWGPAVAMTTPLMRLTTYVTIDAQIHQSDYLLLCKHISICNLKFIPTELMILNSNWGRPNDPFCVNIMHIVWVLTIGVFTGVHLYVSVFFLYNVLRYPYFITQIYITRKH